MSITRTAGLARWRYGMGASELVARLLGRMRVDEVCDPGNYARGLVLVQIDGLSRTVLERALAEGRMPVLARLLRREGYRLHTLYSGLPSSTPSVQAELFYGIRTAVPAFAWRERDTGRLLRMYQPASAARVEQELLARNGGQPGLLAGGSSWCNIYTGGAAEAHYCAASLDPVHMLRRAKPLVRLVALLVHLPTLLSALLAGLGEAIRGLVDALAGIAAGFDVRAELKFVGARVGAGILLRDLITIGAAVDIHRGLPIIHLNFIGYDEHAHRRGPASRFALATLPGIDRRIRWLHSACQGALARHYDLWVFSDHGQQFTSAYEARSGRSLDDTLRLAVHATATRSGAAESPSDKVADHRASVRPSPDTERLMQLRIAAMGPVGHVYFSAATQTDDARLWRIAHHLVHHNAIPAVLRVTPSGRVRAVCAAGEVCLPAGAAELLGADHPQRAELTDDLVALARHRHSGDLILLGWAAGAEPISFVEENGSHGGAGPEETRGFLLLPGDVEKPTCAGAGMAHDTPAPGVWRPDDLRRAALQVLGRHRPHGPPLSSTPRTPPAAAVVPPDLRVMSYNVHGCVGTDGRLSPERIARVIARHKPDVVALQELDVGRHRSHRHDQVATIASALKHQYRFHAVMEVDDGAYGDAILTQLPIKQHREGLLGPAPSRPTQEPRGVIWVTLDWFGQPLQVFNTHLGLYASERSLQVTALLSDRWLGHADCRGPIVFCGDLNALPGAPALRRLRSRLVDAHARCLSSTPRNTFPSRMPLLRIDHVLLDGIERVMRIQVPVTALERVASDHLPIVVDLRIAPSAVTAVSAN